MFPQRLSFQNAKMLGWTTMEFTILFQVTMLSHVNYVLLAALVGSMQSTGPRIPSSRAQMRAEVPTIGHRLNGEKVLYNQDFSCTLELPQVFQIIPPFSSRACQSARCPSIGLLRKNPKFNFKIYFTRMYRLSSDECFFSAHHPWLKSIIEFNIRDLRHPCLCHQSLWCLKQSWRSRVADGRQNRRWCGLFFS